MWAVEYCSLSCWYTLYNYIVNINEWVRRKCRTSCRCRCRVWHMLLLTKLSYGNFSKSQWLRWTWIALLSASLYFSKRGAYWDRLCRDVVGRWLVVTRVHCGQTVHPRPIVTYYGTLIGNPTPGIQWYNFRPPGVTPNRVMGPPWGAFCQITLTSCSACKFLDKFSNRSVPRSSLLQYNVPHKRCYS